MRFPCWKKLCGLTVTSALALAVSCWTLGEASAQDHATPIITRGHIDAPVVVLGADPNGGGIVVDMRVKDGQQVKRGEIVAITSNFPSSDAQVRYREAVLKKAQQQHEAMVSGFRLTEIQKQQIVIGIKRDEVKLRQLELQRSGKPTEIKQAEMVIAEQSYERENIRLQVLKEKLSTDRAMLEAEIKEMAAQLERAKVIRDLAVIRSPIDGIIVSTYAPAGQRVDLNGIVKIVDMSRARVIADVDEVLVERLVVGGQARISFRGSDASYLGKIVKIGLSTRRMQRIEPETGSATDSRVVEVEIGFDDDLSKAPEIVLGRETRIKFL